MHSGKCQRCLLCIGKVLGPTFFVNRVLNIVLNTGILDVENNKPVFDPDFHTELIIKDEYEGSNLGNMKKCILFSFFN